MAMRVLYLDVDDEITSAAARIRSADEIRVAIVLPGGSRVATSRINFRLLTRDATLNGKRLSIIAGDAATRALAASAGLPIFATVAEYESSLEAEKGPAGDQDVSEVPAAVAPDAAIQAIDAPPPRKPRGGSRRKAAEPSGEDLWTAAAATAPGAPTTTPIVDAPAGPQPESPAEARPRDQAHPITPAVGAAGAAAAGAAAAGAVPARPRLEPMEPSAPVRAPSPRIPAAVSAERVMADTPSRSIVIDRPFAPLTSRMPVVVGTAVLVLALIVGGVGAYLLLPTASVTITPRETSIGPIALQITASPSQTEPDQAAKVVPALSRAVDVDVTQTFQVTGKRVELTKATGRVRFRNYDSGSSNTIQKGSVVGTRSGLRFRTDKTITIRPAEQQLGNVFPTSATVTVTAVQGGPDGNVAQDSIRLIPAGEDPQKLDVTNPDATSGGKREEFPRVAQTDLDAATAALRAQLASDFATRVADPALAADGTTVFPDTAVLGEPSFSVEPATLLGDEVATFDLGASANGTVLAVDESAVELVAGADIASHVEPGYSLVEGSSQVDPSPGVVESGVITFPVTVTAKEVLTIDPDAIEAEIRGKSLPEAQAILARYGAAQLSVWPEWVGSIPTLDARVDVRSTAATAEPAP